MADDSLQELLVDNLKDLLDAEKQITRALPKMARKASSEELRAGLETHLQQTETHIERLNEVFELLGETARGKKCKGIQGLIEEGSGHMQEYEKGSGLDAVIIEGAQKVEHYEMAAYGTLRTWARQLGHTEAARLLEQTLEEEKATDQQLTDLAESMVNPQADESAVPHEAENTRGSRKSAASRGRATVAAERGSRKSARSSGRSGSRSRKRSR